MGAKELRVLAWHAYWIHQQEVEEEHTCMEKIETDPPLFEDHHLLPSDVNYKGMGIILILGCSEEGANGEYYGVTEQSLEYSSLGCSIFKKNKDEAVESLSILRTFDDDCTDRSADRYALRYSRVEVNETGARRLVKIKPVAVCTMLHHGIVTR